MLFNFEDSSAPVKLSVRQLSLMRVTILLLTAAMVCNLAVTAPAQRRRGHKVRRDVRILKHTPTIYITFEGFGAVGNSLEAQTLKAVRASKSQEQGQYVWLRLHNNTRWVIDIPTIDLFFTTGGVRVIHPRYQVEERDGNRTHVNEVDDHCGTCGTTLQPGSSALFSVLREHLSNGRKVYINFRYKWEYDKEYSPLLEPIHRVEFVGELSKNTR